MRLLGNPRFRFSATSKLDTVGKFASSYKMGQNAGRLKVLRYYSSNKEKVIVAFDIPVGGPVVSPDDQTLALVAGFEFLPEQGDCFLTWI